MRLKGSKYFKIISSITISIVLILLCFYKYSKKINSNYIEQIKSQVEHHSYINVKLFEARINGLINKLNTLNQIYFDDYTEITQELKYEIQNQFSDDENEIVIYTYDEFKEYIQYDLEILEQLNLGTTIIYIYKDGIIDKFQVAVPIVYQNDIIGVSTVISPQSKFKSITQQNRKIYSYIFKEDGDIIFAGDRFEHENVFEILQDSQIIEEYSFEEIKEKIENGEIFSLTSIYQEIEHYMIFIPFGNGIYGFEMSQISSETQFIRDNAGYALLALIQVIIIIFFQVFYLTWIIIQQNKRLLDSEMQNGKEIRKILNTIPGGVIQIICKPSFEAIFANDGFFNLTGYTKKEFLEKFKDTPYNFIYENDRKSTLDELLIISELREKLTMEFRIVKKSGELAWISVTGEYLGEEVNGFPIYQVVLIDTTEFKGVLEAFSIEKEQYKIISEMSSEIIFEYDLKNDNIHITNKYRETFDIDLVKQPFIKTIIKNKVIHKDDVKPFFNSLRNIEENDGILAGEIRIKNNSNEYNWVFYQGTVIRNFNGQIDKVIGIISSIDEFKKEIEELKEKSNRDPLTKVYNKIFIEEIVNNILDQKDGEKHALFIIDIDNFKAINDTFGHVFGDFVLKEISTNIIKIFDNGEIIARIGGDEFVVFLKNIKDIYYVEEKAELLCGIFRKSYTSGSQNYKISASIGIALTNLDDSISYKSLLEKADIAVYTAKKEGKDQYVIYNEDMKSIHALDMPKTRDNIREIKVYRNSFYENILTNVSEMLLQDKDISSTISLILSTLCQNFEIDKATIFEVSMDEKFANKKYEWCNQETLSSIENIEYPIPFNQEEYLSLYNGEPFLYYKNLDDEQLENIKLSKFLYKDQGIKAILTSYFMEKGKVKGYVVLQGHNIYKPLQQEQLEGILVICRLIGSQILKNRVEERLHAENRMNKAIVYNQQLYTYTVKEGTFEVVYSNDKIRDIMPDMKVGRICYKARGYNSPCRDCPISSPINTTQFYCDFTNSWYGATSTKFKGHDGDNSYLICYRDISKYIEQINYTDLLTGAPTLSKFTIHANEILNNFKEYEHYYAILYMDIDKFKYINDNFGYSKGDEVLKELSRFLYDILGKDDIFCRASDDRFLVLVKYFSEDELKHKVENIFIKLQEIQNDLFKGMNTTVICGIYKIKEFNDDLNFMIDKANIARKSIKGSHRNTYTIYSREMNKAVKKEKLIEGRMKYALENKEFLVYLQPKFNLFTKEVCGAEALVRWRQFNGKMILPSDFIPIFEKNGFITDLDFYVYEMIFKKIRIWIDEGKKLVPISLNVSRVHINSLHFVDKMVKMVNKYKIPYNLIELELTESIFSKDIERLKDIIDSLRLKGFRLSIDDFGSAYSSLNLLKEISVDTIKIDKGFLYNTDNLNIEQFNENLNYEKEKVIVKYIVKMAKSLGLNVICEGVETNNQIEFLKLIGCEMGQGYAYSKPIEIYEFEEKYL